MCIWDVYSGLHNPWAYFCLYMFCFFQIFCVCVYKIAWYKFVRQGCCWGTLVLKRPREPHHRYNQNDASERGWCCLMPSLALTERVAVRTCRHVSVCVWERGRFSCGSPLEDNKHFKGSLCDTEHDICLKTRGLSADPPLFSLRLARRQSKM